MRVVTSYGKNFAFRPSSIELPDSAQALRGVVLRAKKLRVMGSKHSWSTGIVTEDTLVSLDRMTRVLKVDLGALLVTVQAGIKLKETLAGAIATGTHGTGLGFQCLAAQVESLRLIDGEGNDRALAKGDPEFDAVVVGLGCFGIIYEVTLSVVRSFQMHAITDLARFDEVIENLDAYVTGFDHFKFWWLVPGDELIVFKNRRTQEPRNDSDLVRWFKDDFLSVVVYRSLVALQRLDRKRLVPLVNKHLGREVGKHFDRICKSYVGFLTPVPPVHRETEWAFDYKDAKRLLREYRRVMLASGHTYNFIQEIRFTRADDFWLSPAYQRDSIWLSMYNMDTPARWSDQLRQFEAFAREHGGRPHWGKEASIDAAYLEAQWSKISEFRDLIRRFDPQGKLVNEWARQVFRL